MSSYLLFPLLKKHPQFCLFSLQFFSSDILDIFVPKLKSASVAQGGQATNEACGGLNVIRSKIIFPNSSVDPQHFLGIIKNINEDLPAMLIEGNTVATTQ